MFENSFKSIRYLVPECLIFRNAAMIMLICLFTFQGAAQIKIPATLEVEVDPLAYIFKGYSVHAAVTHGSFRSSAGVFAIEQPAFFINNDSFFVYSSGVDVKTDYLFGKKKGWHSGLQLTYSKEKVTLKETQKETELWGINIGIRAGYRFMFGKEVNKFKGFYINPWVALIYSADPATITMGNHQYRQTTFSPFPAIHAGWRF